MGWREYGCLFVLQDGSDRDEAGWLVEQEGVVAGGCRKYGAAEKFMILLMVFMVPGLGLGQGLTDQIPEPETGRLQVGEELFIFRVLVCEFETRASPSGETWEVWLLGEGRHKGEDFFLEVARGRHRGREQTSLRLYKTAMPQGWYNGGPVASDSREEDLLRVRTSDGMEATPGRESHLESQVLSDSQVRLVGPVRLLRLRRGHADALVGLGTLDVNCSQ